MQTFLPYSDFLSSAKCLDNKRLGKQRVECLQILNTLLTEGSGWSNHPAVKMWKFHEACLADYGFHICNEWIGRGFRDTVAEKLGDLLTLCRDDSILVPYWMGDPNFHRSHQSNLVRKLPDHYRKFFPDVPDDLPYVWPV